MIKFILGIIVGVFFVAPIYLYISILVEHLTGVII